VVLAARGEEALAEAADEVRAAGGVAFVVPTDVSDWDQVAHLAEIAVGHFGRIDTWVNCAGVNVFGRVQDTPPEEHRRVIEVDLLGQVHGMKAALDHLRREGRGSIINVSAAAAVRSTPLQAAFSAAMHGVRGFTETLQIELAKDEPGIALCVVMPAAVNTPFYTHARSHLDGVPRPLTPVYQPGAVAEVILSAATRHHRDVFVGVWGELLEYADTIDPSILDWLGRGASVQRLDKSPLELARRTTISIARCRPTLMPPKGNGASKPSAETCTRSTFSCIPPWSARSSSRR
jgi:NAD(P)-dependent dehydrogenase (short-subunit alcohol dehydrogenase family)